MRPFGAGLAGPIAMGAIAPQTTLPIVGPNVSLARGQEKVLKHRQPKAQQKGHEDKKKKEEHGHDSKKKEEHHGDKHHK